MHDIAIAEAACFTDHNHLRTNGRGDGDAGRNFGMRAKCFPIHGPRDANQAVAAKNDECMKSAGFQKGFHRLPQVSGDGQV